MWEQLTQADMERVRQLLATRRVEIVKRCEEELDRLDTRRSPRRRSTASASSTRSKRRSRASRPITGDENARSGRSRSLRCWPPGAPENILALIEKRGLVC